MFSDFKMIRLKIQERTSSKEGLRDVLHSLDVDVTESDYFKVRDERSPSCKLNVDGSCYDYGTGTYYQDAVSLLFDGYKAFNSLPATMQWLCELLNIQQEAKQ